MRIPPGYRPRDDEPFMNPVMREYFRTKLLIWKEELRKESGETLQHLQEESLQEQAEESSESDAEQAS